MKANDIDFRDDDRQIWDEDLSDFLPERIFDAHNHLHYNETLSEESRKETDMAEMDIEGDAFTVKSPDQKLLEEKSDAICTSDGAIIDSYQSRIIDLPRFLLLHYFQAEFPKIITSRVSPE